jgi:signal transduction histidine kinase/putative methionine-R-sulfoxide reductase with GAF domain
VATLVARVAAPEEVFAAVATEVGRLLKVGFTILSRYESDGTQVSVGAWSGSRAAVPFPVGTRVQLCGRNVVSLVVRTGRPARIDDYADASGPVADAARGWGLRSAVGVPISVDGRLWGVISVASGQKEPLPPDTEVRLAGFTELVATALANAQTRVELRGLAEEQAALRRVATLVARATPPEEVFAAVTAEVGRLLKVDFTILVRYDPDATATTVGAWNPTGGTVPFPIGTQWGLGGRNVTTLVFQTRRPARMDDFTDASGPTGGVARRWGFRASVGAPIDVEGRLWGFISAVSSRAEPLPADTEARLAGFTELVATAIADAQARVELRGYAEEQAALRRVATLVAGGAPPEAVFAAVPAEVGRVLGADVTALSRYDPDGTATVVAGWGRTAGASRVPVGARIELGGRNMHTLVFETGRPARIDEYADASGEPAALAREWGFPPVVGVPINVEGRLWGAVMVISPSEQPLPAGTEARLAGFTELVATAIANAEAQAALTASRARIVAAADTARRRIERDLHDGAQQRLVSLALHLRAAQAAAPPEAGDLAAQLDGVADGLTGVLDELREIARGIHPAILADGGLRPALKTLARRSAVPVRLDIGVDGRLPEQIELAAYYVVSEALTNTAKHAHASVIDVDVETGDGVLHVRVRDDGRGGADLTGGSGLVGLTDRVEALGGRLSLRSPPGAGTAVEIALPLTDPSRPEPPFVSGGKSGT